MSQEILKALLKKDNRTDVEVFSRGTYVESELKTPPKIKNFLQKNNIYPPQHIPVQYCRQDLENADLIFVMTQYQYDELTDKYAEYSDKIYMLNEYIYNSSKDVPDPIGLEGKSFEKSAEKLKELIETLYKKI